MSSVLSAIRRVIDPYLLCLIGTVVLAALLPARGVGAGLMDDAVYAQWRCCSSCTAPGCRRRR